MNRATRARAEAMNRRALRLYAQLGRTPTVAPLRDWGDLHRTRPGEKLLPSKWPAECGAWSGIRQHHRNGEPMCDRCRAFNAAAKRKGTGTRRTAA